MCTRENKTIKCSWNTLIWFAKDIFTLRDWQLTGCMAFNIILHMVLLRQWNKATYNKSIPRSGGNFRYIESLRRGTQFLVVFIQISPVHSKFDIQLCWEINRRWHCFSWTSPITATPLYLVKSYDKCPAVAIVPREQALRPWYSS